MIFQPESVSELQALVKTKQHLLLRGGGSKPALSGDIPGALTIETNNLTGILEYEPGEYTFTAYAGTPLAAIQETLAENGQFLPFDPLFINDGATLGGTVAANTSGSGRLRYGGVRDFIIGVRFVDGRGRLIRSGGKVVKNAAGFDLPKFMVGSLGRYGALVEITFKVFPEPHATGTLALEYANLETAVSALFSLAPHPFEIDALDLIPQAKGLVAIHIRIGGRKAALAARRERLFNQLQAGVPSQSQRFIAEDQAMWLGANHLDWAGGQPALVKVPLPPKHVVRLDTAVRPICPDRRYTAAGNVAWLATDDISALDSVLQKQKLAGLVLNGKAGHVYVGLRQGISLAKRIKTALDPENKFLPDRNVEQIDAASHQS